MGQLADAQTVPSQDQEDVLLPGIGRREEGALLLRREEFLPADRAADAPEFLDGEAREGVLGEGRQHPAPGGPVERRTTCGKDELDTALLVGSFSALGGAIAAPLLPSQPFDQVFDGRLLYYVHRGDAGRLAEVEEAVERGTVAVLGTERQFLDVSGRVEKALDHLLGAGTAVRDRRGTVLGEGVAHLVGGVARQPSYRRPCDAG